MLLLLCTRWWNLVKLEEQLNSVKLFNSFSVKVLWLHHFSHFKLDWTSHQGIHCEELPPGCELNGQLYHDFFLHNSVTSDSCVPGAKIRTKATHRVLPQSNPFPVDLNLCWKVFWFVFYFLNEHWNQCALMCKCLEIL